MNDTADKFEMECNKLLVYGLIGFVMGMIVKLLTSSNLSAIIISLGVVVGFLVKKYMAARQQKKYEKELFKKKLSFN